ncbi:unnamed protein product, partial [Polarella glacialis]
VTLPGFRRLGRPERVKSLEDFRQEVASPGAGGRPVSELFGSSAVLELGPGAGVRLVRDLLKAAVGAEPLDSLPCTWRAWPATTYACRDAFLVPTTVALSGVAGSTMLALASGG